MSHNETGIVNRLVERWRANADMLAEGNKNEVACEGAGMQRACADELDAALQSLTWQPIATAPKDGTWFLGWHYDFGHCVCRDGPGFITGEDPIPTHWMPLPAPPMVATGEDQ